MPCRYQNYITNNIFVELYILYINFEYLFIWKEISILLIDSLYNNIAKEKIKEIYHMSVKDVEFIELWIPSWLLNME